MKTKLTTNQAYLDSQLRIARYQAKSVQDLLDYALTEILTLTGSKIGYICSYNHTHKEFTLNAWSRGVLDVCSINNPQTRFHLDSTGIWGEAVRQERPIVINDFESPNPLKKGYPESHARLKRFLTLPVFSGNHIAATIGIANKTRNYTDKDIHHVSLLMNFAWQIAERIRFEESLGSTSRLLNELKDTLPVGFFWKGPDLKYLDCNKYFAKLAGFESPEEIIGKTDDDLTWKSLAEKFRRIDAEIFKTGTAQLNQEECITDRHGEILWLHIHKMPLKDTSGNTIGVVGTFRNITRQKQTEIRNLRLAAIVNSTDDAIIGTDPDGIITDWNASAERIYGYTEAEAVGMPIWHLAPPNLQAERLDKMTSLKKGEHVTRYETQSRRKNGQLFDIAITASPITGPDGHIIGISAIGRDITDYKKHFREQERSRNFLENIEEGCFETDLKGTVTYVNPAAAKMIGESRDRVIGINYSQYTTREEAKKIFAIFNKTYSTGKPDSITEMEMVRRNGDTQYVDLMVSPIIDTQGQVSGFRSTIRDVTQKKREREELQRYRDFVINVEDACFEFDFYGNCFFCNEPTYRMVGYTREEYMKLRHRQRYPNKEEADRAAAIIRKVFETGQPTGLYESQILCKDGSVVTIEMNVNIIRDKQGNAVGWRGTGRDITAKKKEQAELERYRDFMENIYDGCFENDLTGTITYTNEIGARRLGLTKEEFIGMNNRQYSKPEEAKRIAGIFGEIYRTGKPAFIDEMALIRKDGQTSFFEMSAALIRDAAGKPVGFRGTTRDITEKKQNQDRLRESEAKYRALTENMNDVVWTTDMNLIITYMSPSIKKALDFTPEELLGRTPGDVMTPASLATTLSILNDELKREREGNADPGRSVSFETVYYHKNGSRIWFDNVASFIRDERGKLTGIHGVSRNITDWKHAAAERERLIADLQKALSEVKTLSGLLPICSHCKKIRDDKGYWNQIENYLLEHSGAFLSHGICPECAAKYYPDIFPEKKPPE